MTKNIIIGILALAVVFLLVKTLQKSPAQISSDKAKRETERVQKSGKLIDEDNPAKIWRDHDSIQHAEKKIFPSEKYQNTLPPETQKYLDEEVMPVIRKAGKELQEFDKVKAVLSGEAKSTNVKVDGKYFKITYQQGNLYAVAERDTAGVVKPLVYKYDIPNVTRVRTGEKKVTLLAQKEEVVDEWSFNDQNFTIGGVEHYSAPVRERQTKFTLKAETVLQVGFKYPVNSQAKFGINAIFNQDSFFSQEIGVGKVLNFSNGNFDTYGKAQLNFNLIKIKR